MKIITYTCDICKEKVSQEPVHLYINHYNRGHQVVEGVDICRTCVLDLHPQHPQPSSTLIKVIKEFFRKT